MTQEIVQRGYRDCIVVSGAGSSEVDGRYYLQNPDMPSWSKAGTAMTLRRTRPQDGGSNNWALYDASNNTYYYGTPGGQSLDVPPPEVWFPREGGAAPVPTFTLIQEPQYKPLGLYTAPDFTTPASIDQQVGGWRYPDKSVTVTESNLMMQPTLRSISGVPVLEFSGDGLVSTETAPPYTAFTALVRLADASDTAHRTILGFELNGINWRINKPGSGDIALQSSAGGHGQHMCTYLWTTDVVIITVTIGVSGCSIFVDGIELPIDQSTLIDITEFGGYFTLGQMHQGSDPWDGDFITAYGYNAADRLKVEAYCETLKGGVL